MNRQNSRRGEGYGALIFDGIKGGFLSDDFSDCQVWRRFWKERAVFGRLPRRLPSVLTELIGLLCETQRSATAGSVGEAEAGGGRLQCFVRRGLAHLETRALLCLGLE